MNIINKEMWKDIEGYEESYQISSFGRIKSKDRIIVNKRTKPYFRKGIILKQNVDKDGYNRIGLSKNGKPKYYYVHRLVAMAFISNPNNYDYVNHKDQSPNKKLNIKINNNVNNLEWCTIEYNNNYGNVSQLKRESSLNRKDISKKTLQYNLNGKFVKEWESQKEIERVLGFKQSNISNACLITPSHQQYGYLWYIKECIDFSLNVNKYKNSHIKSIYQYNESLELVKFWEGGACEIAEFYNMNNSQKRRINSCCTTKYNKFNGFVWSYNEIIDEDWIYTNNFLTDNK